MKKIIILIISMVLYSNIIFAKEMNILLEKNYKITKSELVKLKSVAYKIFTLQKGRNIYICAIEIYAGIEAEGCVLP